MLKPTLVVMAAGMGSRYGGLKQIDPIGPSGEIVVDYSVYDALNAGFGRVVFVIKEEIEQVFRELVGKTIEKQCETVYVMQRVEDLPGGFDVPPGRQKPWGTGHATLSCRHVVHAPFAVINADDFYGRTSYQTICGYLENAQDRDGVRDYCMVGYVLKNTLTEYGHVARGVCTLNGDGSLTDVREYTRIKRFGEIVKFTEDGENWAEISDESIVSLNMWGFTPSLFPELEARFAQFLQESGANAHKANAHKANAHKANAHKAEYFLPNVVGNMVQEGKARVQVLPTNERWFGVTYRQDKPRVKRALQELIRRGVYPENLWGDVR